MTCEGHAHEYGRPTLFRHACGLYWMVRRCVREGCGWLIYCS